jgi:acetolactate synthase-1/2/3 large subunit
LGFPSFRKVADAFGISYRIISSGDMEMDRIQWCIDEDGPQVCEVVLDPTQPFEPKISTRRNEDGTLTSVTLEDMAPFLSAEERERNMRRDER